MEETSFWVRTGSSVIAAVWSIFFALYLADGSVRISWTLFMIGMALSGLLGLLIYVTMVLQISPKVSKLARPPKSFLSLQKLLFEKVYTSPDLTSHQEASPIFSRNVDHEINGILQKIIDDFVMSWLQPLTEDSEEIDALLKKDLWVALKKLHDRLINVDKVQLLACELVQKITEHFSRLRLATSQQASVNSKENENVPTIVELPIPAFLFEQEREIALLAKITDILILFLLPPSYSSCLGTRSTLRDLLSRSVFHKAIEKVTDPASINSYIISWVDSIYSQDAVDGIDKCDEIKMDTFNNANSYSEFLSSLTMSNDPLALKQQRYNILAEIVQATTLCSLTVAKGDNKDKIKTYITQLVRAKSVSEDRLQQLGCDPYSDNMNKMLNSVDTIDTFMAGRKNLSFGAIMNSPFSRRYFYTFLEQQHMQDLLGFWAAVEELKEADKTLWHQLATEIFYTYINKPSKVIKVSRESLKKIEAFLIGDASPDIFYDIQKDVMFTLETSYYPAFLISDLCYKMLDDAHENNVTFDEPESCNSKQDSAICSPSIVGDAKECVNYLAENHLEHINEKLQNKAQALRALTGSLKSDSKVLKMLQEQVETLQSNKLEVEQHIERTEAWSEHLGQWRCHVQNVEYFEEDEVLKATLIVHVPLGQGPSSRQQRPPSWVCCRNVQDFHSLNRELTPYFSWLKSMSLPSASGGSSSNSGSSLINFGSRNASGNNSLNNRAEKARTVLQKYMDAILSDEKLNQSEAIYSFLSPSPGILKNHLKSDGNNETKFQFPSLFKNNKEQKEKTSNSSSSSSTERRLKWLDGNRAVAQLSEDQDVLVDHDAPDLGTIGDSVAEPLYALIGEVFDLRGVFKILRKSMMTFVQITYGSTINRKIKDTVTWLTSDLMITRYLRALKRSAWPEEVTAKDEDQTASAHPDEVRDKAKAALLEHIPEWLTQLVGQQSSKVGISKVFDTLQEKTLNKLLLYDLLETVIYNLFPELVRSYAFQQFRTMSE